ncbi:MAG TPA: hypothetical protein VMW51_02800, partial [Terriglobia bacterium]|nr:hypothetical protein [Terriglobia bacterium]
QNNLDFVKLQIRERLVEDIYGVDVADRIKVENDPLVETAVTHLGEAQQLLVDVKSYMASRENK